MDTNLIGQFVTDKSNLIRSDLHLVIGQRKKPTPTKPKYYLLARLSPSNHVFISSLYPTGQEGAEIGQQVYSLDHTGRSYTLVIDQEAGKATITANSPINSTVSINNVESGAKFTPNAKI